MISLVILPIMLSCVTALPRAYVGDLYAPVAYKTPVLVAAPDPVAYSATNVASATGSVKQQTAVGKDHLGGHSIRHSAQAANVDPHTGQTDVKHDEHEFHINPYRGEAAASINQAEGSLNPTIGKAAYVQKTHEAKIGPGHASVADAADTAAVSPHSSAASRDVQAARTDLVHDGIAKSQHKSHKSYASVHGVAGQAKASETNLQSYDGHGYGELHYDDRSADEAYDAHGHQAANEAGYKLNQAYDARVNLGASNELQYSRHASHDPYGNYAAVTQTKSAAQGGHLIPVKEYLSAPVQETVYVEPVPVKYSAPIKEIYTAPIKEVIYSEPQPYAYSKQISYDQHYDEPLPVSYQKQASLVYGEPVSYQKQSMMVMEEPSVVYKRPVSYRAPYSPNEYKYGEYYY